MEVLRVLRERQGWTQEELAGRLDVNQATIARWEIGARRPRGKRLAAIANAFGVTPRDLWVLVA